MTLRAPAVWASRADASRMWSMNISSALHTATGVEAATLPTSSSAWMIFLMRATGNLQPAERLPILRAGQGQRTRSGQVLVAPGVATACAAQEHDRRDGVLAAGGRGSGELGKHVTGV